MTHWLIHRRDGQSIAEYVLLIALVAVVALVAIQLFGSSIIEMYRLIVGGL